MVREYYYPNTGVRVDKPYTFTRVKVNLLESGSIDVPVYVYVGDGEKAEFFDNYCVKELEYNGRDVDEFTAIDASIEQVILLICMPKEFARFDEFLYDIQTKALAYYRSLIYLIVEFDSISDVDRCLKYLPKRDRELKYDDKTKKFYLKVYNNDGLAPLEFGNVSMVPNIRYKTLEDISSFVKVT